MRKGEAIDGKRGARLVALWIQRRSKSLMKRGHWRAARELHALAAELDQKGLPQYLRGPELPENVIVFPGGEPETPICARIVGSALQCGEASGAT